MEQFLKFEKTLNGDNGKSYTYCTYIPLSKISFISSVFETNSLKLYTIDQDRSNKIFPAYESKLLTTQELEKLIRYAYENPNEAIISLESIGIFRKETSIMSSTKRKYDYSAPIGTQEISH